MLAEIYQPRTDTSPISIKNLIDSPEKDVLPSEQGMNSTHLPLDSRESKVWWAETSRSSQNSTAILHNTSHTTEATRRSSETIAETQDEHPTSKAVHQASRKRRKQGRVTHEPEPESDMRHKRARQDESLSKDNLSRHAISDILTKVKNIDIMDFLSKVNNIDINVQSILDTSQIQIIRQLFEQEQYRHGETLKQFVELSKSCSRDSASHSHRETALKHIHFQWRSLEDRIHKIQSSSRKRVGEIYP